MTRPRISLLLSLLSLLPSPALCQNATTTVTTDLGCAQIGYYSCPASVGGGCCPTGLICGVAQCFASTQLILTTITNSGGGKTTTELAANVTSSAPVECGSYDGFFSCARDVGGGCCPFGYSCDTNNSTRCRLTLKLNEQTEVITTTSGSRTSVYTTTSIVGPSVTAAGRIAMTSPADSSGGGSSNSNASAGLTGSQVGGIAAGVVGGTLLLASATWFTMAKKRKEKIQGSGDDGEDANAFEKQELDGEGLKHYELVTDHHRIELDAKDGLTEVQGGRLDHELPGGYETHGVSELEGLPVEQTRPGEK